MAITQVDALEQMMANKNGQLLPRSIHYDDHVHDNHLNEHLKGKLMELID
jgi:hypothetical protein